MRDSFVCEKRGYDHEVLFGMIGFEHHDPWASPEMHSCPPPAGQNIRVEPDRIVEHTAEICFCEVTVAHPLLDMRAELELPVPPRGPP